MEYEVDISLAKGRYGEELAGKSYDQPHKAINGRLTRKLSKI
jgi:hypothetical protein